MRKHIGRIGVTLGLVLFIAGCSALDAQPGVRTAGKNQCKPATAKNGKKYLVCTTVTVIDLSTMNVRICDSTGMGVGC